MPVSCCANGCENRKQKKDDTVCTGESISFYRFPVDKDRRRLWIAAVDRKEFHPTEYTRLCSQHFISGKFYIVSI